MFKFFRDRKRKRLAERSFPEHWRAWMDESLSWFSKIETEEEQERVRTHLKVFVWEKAWFGGGGFEVTERMKVLIAAGAARLSRNLELDVWDRLTEVVVYADRYEHPDEEESIYLGEAHSWGTIVLSWRAVQDGLEQPHDGRDTTLHEFAHALDRADGSFDGVPPLGRAVDYERWQRAFTKYYRQLRRRPRRGVVRAYGAQNPAEFFAVATEMFFERPKALAKRAPELYAAMRNFYRVPLARWAKRRGRRQAERAADS